MPATGSASELPEERRDGCGQQQQIAGRVSETSSRAVGVASWVSGVQVRVTEVWRGMQARGEVLAEALWATALALILYALFREWKVCGRCLLHAMT
jgi:hypothetical protein